MGGQWIGPTQDRLAALARELGVETFPTYAQGHNLLEYGGSVRRYRGTIPRINPAVLVDVQQAQTRLNRLARKVPLDAPWEAPSAAKLDGQTMATWMSRNMATKSGRMLLQLGVEAVWAAQPEDMSLLHVLFYIHSAGSLELLFDTEGGAQQDRFVGGSQRIALRMAEELGEERVHLGAPVRRIEHGPDGVTVHADDVTARGRRAIVAIAPTLAGRIAYDPPLPGYRDQLTQRMPLGTVAKCMAIYAEPFWRSEGLTGQATSEAGPVRLTFDNSPPDGSPGVLLGFLEGRHARELGRVRPGGAAHRRDRLLHALLRSARGHARRLRRTALGRGGVDARVLRLPHAHRRLDELRPGAARADRPAALGRRRVRAGLERLHGRGGALGRGYGCRGSGAVDEEPDLRGDSHRRLAGTAPTEGLPRRRKTR